MCRCFRCHKIGIIRVPQEVIFRLNISAICALKLQFSVRSKHPSWETCTTPNFVTPESSRGSSPKAKGRVPDVLETGACLLKAKGRVPTKSEERRRMSAKLDMDKKRRSLASQQSVAGKSFTSDDWFFVGCCLRRQVAELSL